MASKIVKAINFIVPLRIFSSRNMSSLGLVALFVLLYILAGGKIGTENIKSMKNSAANQSFGVTNTQVFIEQPIDAPAQAVDMEAQKKEMEKNKKDIDSSWEKINNKLKGVSVN